jgi:hypothetical protein
MKGYFDKVIVSLMILLFIVPLVFLSFNDFWQDELYSLEHFVFVSPLKTLTDYSNTNNHILQNLFFNIYLHLLPGVGMKEVLEHPILVRGVLLVFTVLTGWFLWKRAARYYSTTTADITALIFFSSIATIHFGVQARGYALSGLFVTLQYFAFLKITRSITRQGPDTARFLLYSFLNMLLLPTSIYLSAAYVTVIVFYWAQALWPARFEKRKQKDAYRWAVLGGLYLLVIGIAVFYYWLLYAKQPPNELIEVVHPFSFANLRQAISVFYYFASYRMAIWIAMAMVFCFYVLRTKRFTDLLPREALLSGALFFLPFFWFFIHGTLIIQRTFIPLLPLFCVFTGTAISYSLQVMPRVWYRLFMAGCVVAFAISLIHTRNLVVENNIASRHVHDLRQHYYLVNFNALETIRDTQSLTDKTKKELVVADSFGETGIYFYLRAFGIHYTLFDQSISPGRIYIANNKNAFETILVKSAIPYRKLYPDTKQYNIYLTGETEGYEWKFHRLTTQYNKKRVTYK